MKNTMMKKVMFAILCTAMHVIALSDNADNELKLRVVPFSHMQWQSINNQVSTNGYCHIKEQNVVLVITNGCPDVEHLLPVWNYIPEADLERNKLHVDGKRGKK